MARTKLGTAKDFKVETTAAFPKGGMSGAPSLEEQIKEATAPMPMPLINPTPMNPPSFKADGPTAPKRKTYRVITGGRLAIRGSCIVINPGQTLHQSDDLKAMELAGIKFVENE